jgi:hypothetical protein
MLVMNRICKSYKTEVQIGICHAEQSSTIPLNCSETMNMKTIFNNLAGNFAGYWDANITVAIAAAAGFLINFESKSAKAILVADSPVEWFVMLFQPELALCRAKG